ncbi:MAG: VOC family protein [Thermoleophilia bacterium]
MPAPTISAGAPCWIDLFSSDTDGATAFYGDLLGWRAELPEEGFGGYFVFTRDGEVVAGCMANDGSAGMPDTWSVYLATDDAERVATDAVAHGGQVHVPPMAIAENGTMTFLADQAGAAIGAWQANRMQGFTVRGEVGTPYWFELFTLDYDRSVDFYRTVFRWDAHTASDAPEFRYTTLGVGEGQLAGIMDMTPYLPEGAPAEWSIYFRVEDVDAALARVEQLGGAVVHGAEDTPYGRLAEAADPTGARFKLIQAP